MTPEEQADLNRRVQTLEHQHTALLATMEKILRRLTALEQAKGAVS